MKIQSGIVPFSLVLMVACSSEKKFSTGVQKNNLPSEENTGDLSPEAKESTIYISNSMSGKLNKPFAIEAGKVTLQFDNIASASVNESSTIKPALDVNFVLDVTSSMGLQLNAAKSGFKAFMESIKAEGFDAKFSLYTFEDTVKTETTLTEFTGFQDKLAQVRLGGGNDIAEASLAALQTALDEGAKTMRSESVPVFILVTDAVGHNGGGSALNRDCNIEKTVSAFSSSFGKSVKLFYAVPSDPNRISGACYTGTINTMYDKIFESIQGQSNTAGEYRGQALGWPFQEKTLTTELPKLLKERIVPRAVSCGATDYGRKSSGTVILEGNASALKSQDGKLELPNGLSGDKLEKLIGAELSMDIKRCCDDTKESGSACKNEKTQSVEFKIDKAK